MAPALKNRDGRSARGGGGSSRGEGSANAHSVASSSGRGNSGSGWSSPVRTQRPQQRGGGGTPASASASASLARTSAPPPRQRPARQNHCSGGGGGGGGDRSGHACGSAAFAAAAARGRANAPAPASAATATTADDCDRDGDSANDDPAASALEALPSDVLARVLGCVSCADAGGLRRLSHRLHDAVGAACQHWAPRVEAAMLSSATLAAKWPALQRELSARAPGLHWLHAWRCLERASVGPWSLDVERLSPREAPNGVLLVFEVLLRHHAAPGSGGEIGGGGSANGTAAAAAALPPPPPSGSSGAGALARLPLRAVAELAAAAGPPPLAPQSMWRDSVPLLALNLDGRHIEIVVDAHGRVTSPQRDWAQGAIALTPGVPQALALEVSYLFPVPAWFVHPCSAHPDDDASSVASSSAAAAPPSVGGDGVGGADDAAAAPLSAPPSPPRPSLNLAAGFGSFIIDPRYMDGGGGGGSGGMYAGAGGGAACFSVYGGGGGGGAAALHGGLDRLELSGRLAWRPSRMTTLLSRLLPGRAAGGGGGGGAAASAPPGSGAGSAAVARPAAATHASPAPAAAAAAVAGGGGKQVATYQLDVMRASAWRVPADNTRRFAEGFMFTVHEAEAVCLLRRAGLLG